MTDETREQIKRDAYEYATKTYGNRETLIVPEATAIWDAGEDDFTKGAESQHPIAYSQGLAEGRRQAVEEAIGIVRSVDHAFIVEELEALKTEIKK